jgi:acyl carrier protein
LDSTTAQSEVQRQVYDVLTSFGADPEAIAPDATFESLDIDSLDLVELAQIVEERFQVQITGEDAEKLRTVGQALDLIASRMR